MDSWSEGCSVMLENLGSWRPPPRACDRSRCESWGQGRSAWSWGCGVGWGFSGSGGIYVQIMSFKSIWRG